MCIWIFYKKGGEIMITFTIRFTMYGYDIISKSYTDYNRMGVKDLFTAMAEITEELNNKNIGVLFDVEK